MSEREPDYWVNVYRSVTMPQDIPPAVCFGGCWETKQSADKASSYLPALYRLRIYLKPKATP